MRTSPALDLAFVLALAVSGAAQASALDVLPAREALRTAPAQRADPQAWWRGFDEPVLDSLQRVARARTSVLTGAPFEPSELQARLRGADAQVALAFIGLRALDVRTALIDEAAAVLHRERELAASGTPSRPAGEAVAQIDARLAAAARAKAGFATDHDRLLAQIASATGLSAELVQATLGRIESRGNAAPIPLFGPGKVPLAVPPLASVGALDAQAGGLLAEVRAQQRTVEATAARWHAGAATEQELLANTGRLLAVQDELAVTTAELACAWIDSYLRHQGAGTARAERGGDEPALQQVRAPR